MTDTKPVAWIHAVTNGEDEDYALSFAPDNFPLKGIAGFKSVDVQPLYTKATLDAAVAQARQECIDIVARHGGSIEIEAAIRARAALGEKHELQ